MPLTTILLGVAIVIGGCFISTKDNNGWVVIVGGVAMILYGILQTIRAMK